MENFPQREKGEKTRDKIAKDLDMGSGKNYDKAQYIYNNADKDMILEDLICTNIMQRGVGNVNPMKMAKCIQELERIKGIKVGRPNSEIISEFKTQANLASEIGLDERQLRNYKQLNDLIPELQTMIENGSMKATVGYRKSNPPMVVSKKPKRK